MWSESDRLVPAGAAEALPSPRREDPAKTHTAPAPRCEVASFDRDFAGQFPRSIGPIRTMDSESIGRRSRCRSTADTENTGVLDPASSNQNTRLVVGVFNLWVMRAGNTRRGGRGNNTRRNRRERDPSIVPRDGAMTASSDAPPRGAADDGKVLLLAGVDPVASDRITVAWWKATRLRSDSSARWLSWPSARWRLC